MKKGIVIAVILLVVCGGIAVKLMFFGDKGYMPKNGVVPDEATAIKIAEAVWFPIYGETIYDKQPYIVTYNSIKGCWHVCGSLPPDKLGGVPEIDINKKDGKVLYINHGQ